LKFPAYALQKSSIDAGTKFLSIFTIKGFFLRGMLIPHFNPDF